MQSVDCQSDRPELLHREMVLVSAQQAQSQGVTCDELVDALGISKSSAGTRLTELMREGLVRKTVRERGGQPVYMHESPRTFSVRYAAPSARVVTNIRREISRSLNNWNNPELARKMLEDALLIGRDVVE